MQNRARSMINWLGPSTTRQSGAVPDRNSTVESPSLSFKVQELESALQAGLDRMEERVAQSEESLKMRITQMEVAVMGALKAGARPSGGGGGGSGGGGRPRLHLGGGTAGPQQPPTPSSGAEGARAAAHGAANENQGSAEDGAGAPSDGYSHAYELHRTGETVQAMQSLVDGDSEVQSMLNCGGPFTPGPLHPCLHT